MIELLQLGRRYSYERLQRAIEQALDVGAADAAAVRYLLMAEELTPTPLPELTINDLRRPEYFTRPLPQMDDYDQLLAFPAARSREVTQ